MPMVISFSHFYIPVIRWDVLWDCVVLLSGINISHANSEAVMVVILWLLDLPQPMQSVPITSKVVSSNSSHNKVFSIQHYLIKFVSDLRQGGGLFSPGTSISSTNKTDHHDIAEILLKVVLNTKNPNPY